VKVVLLLLNFGLCKISCDVPQRSLSGTRICIWRRDLVLSQIIRKFFVCRYSCCREQFLSRVICRHYFTNVLSQVSYKHDTYTLRELYFISLSRDNNNKIINKSFIKRHWIRLLKIIYYNEVMPSRWGSFTAWEVKLTHPGGFVTLTTCVWLLYYRYGNAFILIYTGKTVQLFLNCTCHAMWSF